MLGGFEQQLAGTTARLIAVQPPMVTRTSLAQSTTEKLTRHILRRLYEATDGRPMEWRTLVTNKTAGAAVELAVDCGWLLADGKRGVCLTDEGRSLVRKELS